MRPRPFTSTLVPKPGSTAWISSAAIDEVDVGQAAAAVLAGQHGEGDAAPGRLPVGRLGQLEAAQRVRFLVDLPRHRREHVHGEVARRGLDLLLLLGQREVDGHVVVLLGPGGPGRGAGRVPRWAAAPERDDLRRGAGAAALVGPRPGQGRSGLGRADASRRPGRAAGPPPPPCSPRAPGSMAGGVRTPAGAVRRRRRGAPGAPPSAPPDGARRRARSRPDAAPARARAR